MPRAIHSPSIRRKQAARDQEVAVRQHRTAFQIRRILDARFSLSTFEAFKNNDPQSWNSARNDMGRGIYGEAQRERQRLEAATESELQAELAAAARV